MLALMNAVLAVARRTPERFDRGAAVVLCLHEKNAPRRRANLTRVSGTQQRRSRNGTCPTVVLRWSLHKYSMRFEMLRVLYLIQETTKLKYLTAHNDQHSNGLGISRMNQETGVSRHRNPRMRNIGAQTKFHYDPQCMGAKILQVGQVRSSKLEIIHLCVSQR